MLALYRAGRQADALRAYQAARAVLGDELGLEPGRELQRLEAAILAQDPDLDPPERPGADDGAASGRSHRQSARRRQLLHRPNEGAGRGLGPRRVHGGWSPWSGQVGRARPVLRWRSANRSGPISPTGCGSSNSLR